MKLALGTVQFGLPYGITNNSTSCIHEDEATKILSYSYKKKIRTLDTAAAYGISETILGKILSKNKQFSFNIITKTMPIRKKHISITDVFSLEQTFSQSLANLKQNNLYGLMIHYAEDLLANDSARVIEKLSELKGMQKIKKIGCSFYSPDELFMVLEKFDLDMVQIPLNLFDQRFIYSGAIQYLQKKNIYIYARSIFLQGLLLSSTSHLENIGMLRAKPYLNNLDKICSQYNTNRLTLIICFLKKIQGCEFLMGFNHLHELQEVLAHVEHDMELADIDFSILRVDDNSIINPTFWKKS